MGISMYGLDEAATADLLRRAAVEFDKSPTGKAIAPLLASKDSDAETMRLEKIRNLAKIMAGATKGVRASIRETLTRLFRENKIEDLSILDHLRKNVMLNRRYLRITVMLEDTDFVIGKGDKQRVEKCPLLTSLAPSKAKKRVAKTERMLQVAAAVNRVRP